MLQIEDKALVYILIELGSNPCPVFAKQEFRNAKNPFLISNCKWPYDNDRRLRRSDKIWRFFFSKIFSKDYILAVRSKSDWKVIGNKQGKV